VSKLLVLLGTIFLSHFVYGQIEIKFEKPLLMKSEFENKAKVIITGKTAAGSKLEIEEGNIVVLGDLKSMSKLSNSKKVTIAKKNGEFKLVIDLPFGIAQIPIQVRSKKVKKIFSISINIKKEDIKNSRPLKKIKKPKIKIHEKKELNNKILSVGIGGNLQSYTQNVDGKSSISFKNITYPTMFLGFQIFWSKIILELGYQDSVGAIESAVKPFTLVEGKYRWQIFNISVLGRFFGPNSNFFIRLGSQYQLIPFFSINSQNEVSVVRNSLALMRLGVDYYIGNINKKHAELGIGFELPVGASASDTNLFSVKPGMILDSYLTLIYPMSKSIQFSFATYLQAQDYGFEFNKVGFFSNKGSQKLIYLDYRFQIGYKF